jgi:hypothetical protein
VSSPDPGSRNLPMNLYCEWEAQIVPAILSRSLTPEIEAHAQTCPVCHETLLVSNQLRSETIVSDEELGHLPDPGLIWRKAQATAKNEAVRKAMWPIRMMRICALTLALLAFVWVAGQVSKPSEWISSFAFGRLLLAEDAWVSAFKGMTLLGMAATAACIGLGSWYMLRVE